MLQRVLADLVLIVHLAFILFVALGGALALWRAKAALVHLPALAWGVAITFGGWICPLTPLEVSLRRAAGEAGYSGGFIEHYLLPVIYPGGLTRPLQAALGVALLALNLAVYALVWRRWRASAAGRAG